MVYMIQQNGVYKIQQNDVYIVQQNNVYDTTKLCVCNKKNGV